MNYPNIRNFLIPLLFSLTFIICEESQPRMKYLPISNYPFDLTDNTGRNVGDFLDQWDVVAEYYPETFLLTVGQDQIAPNLNQLSGIESLSDSATLYFGSDTALINYMHINKSNYGRSYLFSNTPITKQDRISPYFGWSSNSLPVDTSLINSYNGDFPRYLFYLSDGVGPFSSQSIIFVHWVSPQNYHIYRSSFSAGHHGMGGHGEWLGDYFDKIDYVNKIVDFDSTEIKMSFLYSNNLGNSGDSLDVMLDGLLAPDSISIIAGQTFDLVDFYGAAPKLTNYNPNDMYFWSFNENYNGYEISKRISGSSWSSTEQQFYVSYDSTDFTWYLNDDSVGINKLGGYGTIDSVEMEYTFEEDSLYLLGNKDICVNNSCPNFNIFNNDYYVDFSGINDIELISINLGLHLSKVDTSVGNISIQDMSGGVISTYLYPGGLDSNSMHIYNLGPGNLEYEIIPPSAPWVIMDTVIDTLQPDSYRTINFSVDLTDHDLAFPSELNYDVVINSNDNSSPVISLPFIIDIMEPVIEIPNFWGFTINEDDSLITNYNLYGYTGGLSSSISVDTDFVQVEIVQLNESNSFQLKAIPSTNWFGSCSIKVKHQNQFGYSDSTSINLNVNPVADLTIGPMMIYPTDSLFIQFSDIGDSVNFSWMDSKYQNSEVGPGFEYELFISQESGDNITNYHFENILDTAFVFFPDTNNFSDTHHTISWTLKTYELNNDEVLHSNFGQFIISINELSVLDSHIPKVFSLRQNYPNPFNPTTRIQYDMPNNEFVIIEIYNILGNRVRSLLKSEQKAGFNYVMWDATNDLGQSLSAGMYIYTIQAGEFRQTRKMLLMK